MNDFIEKIPGKAAHITEEPVDMLLYCPHCRKQHIDAPEDKCRDCGHQAHQPGKCLNMASDNDCDCRAAAWLNPPHKTHRCHFCNRVWQPFEYATNGVAAVESEMPAG